MNRDVSTGPLACPFARSLAPLTRSLARSLCSLPRLWESEWLEGYLFCVFFLFWPIVQRQTKIVAADHQICRIIFKEMRTKACINAGPYHKLKEVKVNQRMKGIKFEMFQKNCQEVNGKRCLACAFRAWARLSFDQWRVSLLFCYLQDHENLERKWFIFAQMLSR